MFTNGESGLVKVALKGGGDVERVAEDVGGERRKLGLLEWSAGWRDEG